MVKQIKKILLSLISLFAILNQFVAPGFVLAQQYEISKEAQVTVGNPSTGCPSGWPTEHGHMSQGPIGLGSHYDNAPEQPIDIGVPATTGTPTYATFDGAVSDTGDSQTVGYGIYAELKAVCNGAEIKVIWAHLQSRDATVQRGNSVTKGQLIGKIDDTGSSQAPHLHYGFCSQSRNDIQVCPIPMAEPYIPQTPVPSNCGDGHVNCNISW
jgi:murein DD-endopeptidase MepM/ murein hydrolase activator NlpD